MFEWLRGKFSGLDGRLFILSAFPFLAFALLALLTIRYNQTEMHYTKEMFSRQEVLRFTAHLIDDLQKERGLSATFLIGSTELSQLKDQRSKVDTSLNTFKKNLSDSVFSKEQKDSTFKALESIIFLRQQVIEKSISAPEQIQAYSEITQALLKLYSYAAIAANADEKGEIATRVFSLLILEEAKENGGKLRATVSSILSKDSPINQQNFNRMIKFKSSLESNLVSPALYISEESSQLLLENRKKLHWPTVEEVVQLVLRKADEGSFGEDPRSFFNNMTLVLDDIGEVIEKESAFVHHLLENLNQKTTRSLWTTSLIMLAVALLLALGYLLIKTRLKNSLVFVVKHLKKTASETHGSSTDLVESSSKLSNASSKQALAIQKTVQTLNKISTMLKQSLTNTSKSSKVADDGQKEALTGKNFVVEMIRAMEKINSSNQAIMKQVDDGNQKISQIVNIIQEIDNKTRVINDIVFQTKLLSFNASVEAARAGEAGKGFAVVAEEVGNLAQMSGNAAQEISVLLESSSHTVEGIVKDTQTKVSHLIAVGKEEVQAGTILAKKCGESIENIVQSVGQMASMFKDIQFAAEEQVRGVNDISKAMSELDGTINENATISERTTEASTALAAQADALGKIVQSLEEEVLGIQKK